MVSAKRKAQGKKLAKFNKLQKQGMTKAQARAAAFGTSKGTSSKKTTTRKSSGGRSVATSNPPKKKGPSMSIGILDIVVPAAVVGPMAMDAIDKVKRGQDPTIMNKVNALINPFDKQFSKFGAPLWTFLFAKWFIRKSGLGKMIPKIKVGDIQLKLLNGRDS